MNSLSRTTVVLGVMLIGAGTAGAVEKVFFGSTPMVVAKNSSGKPMLSRAQPYRHPEPAVRILRPDRQPASRNSSISVNELYLDKPAPAPVENTQRRVAQADRPEEFFPAEKAAPPILAEAASLATAEAALSPEASPAPAPLPPPPETIAEASEDSDDLLVRLGAGYGGKFVKVKQSGALGSGEASGLCLNERWLESRFDYGAWNLTGLFRQSSMNINTNISNPSNREQRDFKDISLRPGYGGFYTGISAHQAPIFRVSGTDLLWADATFVGVLAGFRWEKAVERAGRKPFRLGFNAQLERFLNAGASGASSIDSASGYGADIGMHVEKLFWRNEDYAVYFGLNGGATYERIKADANSAVSTGQVTLTSLEGRSTLYLGLDF